MVPLRCISTATLLLLACARPKPAPGAAPVAAAGPADSRCTALADSVRAATALSQLTLAPPQGPLRTPPLGGDVAPGGSVEVTVLVRPDGTADLTRLEVRGTRDAGYVGRLRTALEAARFRPPTVGGCAVPGRFTLVTTRARPAGGPGGREGAGAPAA